MAKNLRVLILLLVLLSVLLFGWYPTSPQPEWDRPQQVTIYPVNADGSPIVDRFIADLESSDFRALGAYFAGHAKRYAVPADPPFRFTLGDTLDEAPPVPDDALSGFDKLKWGITLRWWHWRLSRRPEGGDIVVVARYRQPVDRPVDLHSIGMPSPRLALVSLVADPDARGINQVKLAHELLHTVGATDFYHRGTGQPLWPSGYADPAREPRFPQSAAELMAGRIPVSSSRSRQAGALEATTIGIESAREIGWL